MLPKYQKIYKNLLDRIENNEFKPGNTLPKEFDLMKEYNVSRDTIRRALRLLSDDGYIHANKGVGSIILDRNRFEFPVSGIVTLKELHKKLGYNVVTEVIYCELIVADDHICKIMNLNKNEKVWIVERVRKVNGEKIILDLDFLNANIIPYLDKQICQNSLYDYIENELNLKISYANKEITCQNATSNDIQLLDMNGYDLVVNVDSYTYLSDTNLFQFTKSRHRPDKFRFVDFAKR